MTQHKVIVWLDLRNKCIASWRETNTEVAFLIWFKASDVAYGGETLMNQAFSLLVTPSGRHQYRQSKHSDFH